MSNDMALSSSVRGRWLFELHCAPCHGPSGKGQYIGEKEISPDISGRSLSVITEQVRKGRGQMPSFGEAVISDSELTDLADFVHATLAQPPPRPNVPPMGLEEASPFLIGLIAWGALFGLCVFVALLFGPGKN